MPASVVFPTPPFQEIAIFIMFSSPKDSTGGSRIRAYSFYVLNFPLDPFLPAADRDS